MIETPAATISAEETTGQGTVPRTNWSGNYRYRTDRVFTPTTVAEVQDAVRSVPHLRALGTRHSFNGIADSAVAQLSTLGLRDVTVAPDRQTVRVGAGIRYGDLALLLEAAGLALHNMASLPHISVGGAVATGTHGSGLGNGSLATAVTALEFVDAAGRLQTLSRAADPDRFPGAVVALGALGIVTHLTLAVQPSFRMVQTVYQNLPFAELEGNLDRIMSAAYSVSLFTDWQGGQATQVWLKRRLSADAPATQIPAPHFLSATLATEKLHPLAGQPAAACTDQDEHAAPWFERLPHFRLDFTPSSGEELQSEYFVPFDRGYDAIRAVEVLRDRITPLLHVTELRAVAADDLWLSMQYRQPSLGIHFTWKPAWGAVQELLPAIEAQLAPFGARPHWGKVFTTPAARIIPLYPRLDAFRDLVRSFDPQGKFSNEFVEPFLSVERR